MRRNNVLLLYSLIALAAYFSLRFQAQAAPAGALINHLSSLLKWTRSSASKAPNSETLEELEFEGGMEPSPSMRYNLRSRGRIIGNRLLRLRRGVPVYNHHHSCQKPYRPSVKKVQKPCGPSILRGTDEELGNQRPHHCKIRKEQRRQSRLRFMEKYRPYPFVAMQHYNIMLKEEEQYKVYDRGDGIMTAYKKVGVFHQLHILGVPKSFEYMQNSSDDDVPVKHFYARIHEAPNSKTYVDHCEPFEGEGPSWKGLDITRVVPLCCKICGLANRRAIKSRSSELSKQAKADGEDLDSESFYVVTRTLMPPKKEGV
ncbi:uncharacterized protein LOC107608834 isoform X3 [Arachis ipaensis]|uniref:uncharacterized protein LOC107608834 isoform X3 n=1 Tax=Arachis ipaensis TaxID=130454 RepID=UPI000A2B794F|nr:uncharacterized protein LOC107608834 isoform X3 [Arachis ipaensis]XP_029150243.1 uncharacterized protein LOC112764163 isoform X3 [Arachis hypogaea]